MHSASYHPEYDANVLARTAPVPTKGYDANLLATEDEAMQPRHNDLESGRFSRPTIPPVVDGMEIKVGSTSTRSFPSTDKIPFYRTRKGTIILVIVAIIISAAIIGGAVGGIMKHKNSTMVSSAFTPPVPTISSPIGPLTPPAPTFTSFSSPIAPLPVPPLTTTTAFLATLTTTTPFLATLTTTTPFLATLTTTTPFLATLTTTTPFLATLTIT